MVNDAEKKHPVTRMSCAVLSYGEPGWRADPGAKLACLWDAFW